MSSYRIYEVDKNGHVVRPPQVIICADDQQAIREAKPIAGIHDVELWNGARIVARIAPDR
jgi:hypothetical protein